MERNSFPTNTLIAKQKIGTTNQIIYLPASHAYFNLTNHVNLFKIITTTKHQLQYLSKYILRYLKPISLQLNLSYECGRETTHKIIYKFHGTISEKVAIYIMFVKN